MNKLFLLVGFAILAVASARVVRDTHTENLDFEKLTNELKENYAKLNSLANSEDVKKNADAFMGTVARSIDTLKKEIDSKTEELKNDEAVKTFRGNVDKVIGDLQNQFPQASDDITKNLNMLKEGSDKIMTQFKALGETEGGKQLKDVAQSLFASAQQQISTMVAEIEKNIKPTTSS